MGSEKTSVGATAEPELALTSSFELNSKTQTIGEKTTEIPDANSQDDAASSDTAERVKGHPVIRNGTATVIDTSFVRD